MIPPFGADGELPPGVHWATWQEFTARFGTTRHRRTLIAGMRGALEALRAAGCTAAYINGSFVTAKDVPADYDACWEEAGVDPGLLDPILLTFDYGRAAQKAKYLGEFFPARLIEAGSGSIFLDFFQVNKDTGNQKGIVALDLRRLP